MNYALIAIRAALQAGMQAYKIQTTESLRIIDKPDNSPVTQADMAANNIIIKALQATKTPILSEEETHAEYASRKSWKSLWIVDPLDGTKEFIAGSKEYAVNIAYIRNNVVDYGVMYAPAYDELYYGGKHYGSFMLTNASRYAHSESLENLQAASITLPDVEHVNHNSIVVSRSYLDYSTDLYVESVRESNLTFTTKKIGASLKFIEVARGRAFLYPRVARINEWDIAAGHAIAEGAGCIMRNLLSHEDITYNSSTLLAPSFELIRV